MRLRCHCENKVMLEVISVKLFTGFVKLYLIEGKVTLNVTSEIPINVADISNQIS